MGQLYLYDSSHVQVRSGEEPLWSANLEWCHHGINGTAAISRCNIVVIIMVCILQKMIIKLEQIKTLSLKGLYVRLFKLIWNDQQNVTK